MPRDGHPRILLEIRCLDRTCGTVDVTDALDNPAIGSGRGITITKGINIIFIGDLVMKLEMEFLIKLVTNSSKRFPSVCKFHFY